MGVVAVLAFGTMALARALQLLTWPSLDFLQASDELRNDPWVRELSEAVVQVRVEDGAPARSGRGTGFNVAADGLVVTNRHVVEGGRQILVEFPQHGTFPAVEGWIHPTADLAVLRLDGEELPTVGINTSRSAQRQDVLIIGNPLGFPGVVMEGRVTATRPASDGVPPAMIVDAPIHPGSSGSPVFDEAGDVIAVIYARVQNGNGNIQGLAVPVRLLEDVLP